MEKTKTLQRTIKTSDITMNNNNFFVIKGINHNYSLYHSYVNEYNELVIILKHISHVRKVINEAVLTCHKDATATAIFNHYEF